MSRPLRAWVEVELCRCCAAAEVVCPGCGSTWGLSWPLPLPPFPAGLRDCCDEPDGCGMRLELVAVGWSEPGAPAQATRPADLSERARLERIWQRPATPRTDPVVPWARGDRAAPPAPPPPKPRPPRPAPLPRLLLQLEPCAAGKPRQRLSDWAEAGLLPDGLAPAAIAAAYRRLFGGAEPRREGQTRIYSRRELRGCLWLLRQEGRATVEAGR